MSVLCNDFLRKPFKHRLVATPNKARLKALYWICLHIFRHLAQKFLDIRQYACGISIQSDEKSVGASPAQALCGIALSEISPTKWSNSALSITHTAAPFLRNPSAMLLPIPFAPPVTTATLFLNEYLILSPFYRQLSHKAHGCHLCDRRSRCPQLAKDDKSRPCSCSKRSMYRSLE